MGEDFSTSEMAGNGWNISHYIKQIPDVNMSLLSMPNMEIKRDALDELNERASHYLAYTIAKGINTFVSPIVFPVGFLGNLLLLVVLIRAYKTQASFTVYLLALAVTDCLVLLLAMENWVTTVVYGGGHTGCMMTGFFFNATCSVRISLIFFITLDRYLAACHPFKALNWRTRIRAVQVTSCVVLVCCLSAVPYMLTCTYVNKFTCAGFMAYTTLSAVSCFTHVICFGILPLSAVLVMNAAIARSTTKRHQQFYQLYGQTSRTDLSYGRLGSNSPASRTSSTSSNYSPRKENSSCKCLGLIKRISGAENENHDKDMSLKRTPSVFSVTSITSVWVSPQHSESSVSETPSIEESRPSKSVSSVAIRYADRQMSRVLLGITIILYIFVVPQLVRYVVFLFIKIWRCPATLATYVLVFNISHKLCIANSTVNVLLYCLSGARFRCEFVKFLRLKQFAQFFTTRRTENVRDNSF